MAEASRRHAERWQQQVMGCASNDTQRGLYRASSLETRNTWSAASSLETHTVMCAALSFSSRTLRLVRARILVQPSAALRLASGRNCSPYLLLLLLLLLDACFVLLPFSRLTFEELGAVLRLQPGVHEVPHLFTECSDGRSC